MKRILVISIGFISLFLLNACSGIKVVADGDPTVNWSEYTTYQYYGWAEESDQLLTRFDKERIEAAFGNEFKRRGMKYVESGGDMIVSLFIVIEQQTSTTASTTSMGGGYGGYYGGYYGYGPGYGWGGGHSTTTISEYDYEVGTLVCDVFDLEKEVLIWEGIGTKTISEDPAKRETTIPKAVQAIMAKFPVSPKK